MKLTYKYESIDGTTTKLKIEVNTTEHFNVERLKKEEFSMESEWFSGKGYILTYELEELMATKLRALYQRRKGRDLFDLWLVLKDNLINVPQTIKIFKKYCKNNDEIITRSLFIKNLEEKRNHKDFSRDMNALLAIDVGWNFDEAFNIVNEKIISKI